MDAGVLRMRRGQQVVSLPLGIDLQSDRRLVEQKDL